MSHFPKNKLYGVVVAALVTANTAYADGVETTTAMVGDVLHELLTTAKCSEVLAAVVASFDDHQPTKEIIMTMGLTFYLQAFAKGRGASVSDINKAFGTFCKSNPNKPASEFK